MGTSLLSLVVMAIVCLIAMRPTIKHIFFRIYRNGSMALIDAGMVIAIKDLSLCSINDSKAMQAFLPKEDTDRTLAHQPLAEYPFCATEI